MEKETPRKYTNTNQSIVFKLNSLVFFLLKPIESFFNIRQCGIYKQLKRGLFPTARNGHRVVCLRHVTRTSHARNGIIARYLNSMNTVLLK